MHEDDCDGKSLWLIPVWLALAAFSGFAWYGIIKLAACVLRACGVSVSGI
jgi:hypothetical protein